MFFKCKKKFLIKITSLIICFYLISSICIVSFAENYEWTVLNNYDAIETNTNPTSETTEKTDLTESTTIDTLNLNCESAILIEQNSGQVLYEKNCHEQLRPASVTKLMTLLLIFEALESNQITLQDKVPCSENAASMGGSQIWLDIREELTVNEMLKAITTVSANDYDVQFRHE